jgi:hypothetical protein
MINELMYNTERFSFGKAISLPFIIGATGIGLVYGGMLIVGAVDLLTILARSLSLLGFPEVLTSSRKTYMRVPRVLGNTCSRSAAAWRNTSAARGEGDARESALSRQAWTSASAALPRVVETS